LDHWKLIEHLYTITLYHFTSMNYTLQQIEDAFAKAPPEVQQALQSEEIGVRFARIAGAFEFSDEQFSEFVDETGLLLLKLTPFVEYERNLATRLSLQPEQARGLVERTGVDILASFKEFANAMPRVHNAPPANLPMGSTNSPQAGSGQVGSPQAGRSTFATPIGNDVLERLEDAREKNILANMHAEKLSGMVASGASQTILGQQSQAQKSGVDPYREPIE
jgi:hypothetical protein